MMSDTRDDEGVDKQACASFLPRGALASFDPKTDAMAAIRLRWQYCLPCPDASTLIVQVIAFELERFSLDAFSLYDIARPDTIARSVRKRQAEFFFGRLAAREALRQQSLIPADSSLQIAIGGSREPIWPATAIGSISHTPHLAAAAVAPLGTWRGIGIDLEHVIDAGSREALLGTVVDCSELSLIQSTCTSTDYPLDTLLTIVFSAKESLFKASFCAVGRYFDFSSAHLVALNLHAGWVRLRICEHLSPELSVGQLCHIGIGFVDPQTVITYRVW